MTIDKQLEELRTQIHYHDYLYYVTNHPEISDNAPITGGELIW